MRFKILTILLFFATSSFGQKSQDSLQFSIYFTKCFQNDTLSLTINGVNIFKQKVLTTASDYIAYDIFQTKTGLWDDQKNKFQKIQIKKINLVEIVINNASEKFDISLKRGKYILIDKCHGDGSIKGWRALVISQLKIAPLFD